MNPTPDNNCVGSRDLYYICVRALNGMLAGCVREVSDGGTVRNLRFANWVETNGVFVEDSHERWINEPDPTVRWKFYIPQNFDASPGFRDETNETAQASGGFLHTQNPLTLSDAASHFGAVMAKIGARSYAKMASLGNYKSLLGLGTVARGLQSRVAWAAEEMAKRQWRRNKLPHGPQKVYTRRWKGDEKIGQRYGRPAYRRPRGRQPLTKAEWLRRYYARLEKRRKTNRRSPRPGVKVPEPKKQDRPRVALMISPGSRALPFDGSRTEAEDLRHLMLEKMFDEMGKELGKVGGEWFVEQVKKVCGWK